MQPTTTPSVTITITLTDEQAWACAQLLKRVGLTHYQALAADLPEAYLMQEAGQAIAWQLASTGYAPR